MRKPITDSFNIRKRMLKKLGLGSYKDYLKSDLWKNLKKEVYAQKKVCDGCGSAEHLQVHHQSYTFMGTKGMGKNRSLKLLCNECHEKAHEIAKNFNLGLVEATKRLLRGEY